MVKLKDIQITAREIAEFADNSSDFGFELKVLSQLSALGIECEHGGTYEDPVTQKPRQFDIRALIEGNGCRIRMAIECKNIRENFPLVIFTVPRSQRECYHTIIYSHSPLKDHDLFKDQLNSKYSHTLKSHGSTLVMKDEFSFYSANAPVGKACSQVGRTAHNGELTGNDAEVYDKWYQAIHSAYDLVDYANYDWETSQDKKCFTVIFPMLVVPNNRLWSIGYTQDGCRTGAPKQIDRICFYLDKFVESSDRLTGIPAQFSHLEILTEDGLLEMCQSFQQGELTNKVFPIEGINSCVENYINTTIEDYEQEYE